MKKSKQKHEQIEELFRSRGQKTVSEELEHDPQRLENGQWVKYIISYENCIDIKEQHDTENGQYTYTEGYDNVNNRVVILKFREIKK